MMRALVVTNAFPTADCPWSGAFVSREVDALRDTGSVEIEVVHVDTVAKRSRYLTDRSVVSDAIALHSPDVIHVHYGLSGLLVPPTSVPLVLTCHGSDVAVSWQRAVTRRIAGRAREVLCVSEAVSTVLGMAAPVSVVPCGVPRALFGPVDRADARARLGWAETERIVLFAAAPERKVKRYDLFEDAIRRLGGAGMSPRVLGDVPVSMVPLALAAADVAVLCSDREGSPVVSKEALCCGTRLVVTDVGDVRWQVEGLEGTRIVPAGDSAAIAEAITSVLEDVAPDSDTAWRRFDIRYEAEAVLDAYRRATAR